MEKTLVAKNTFYQTLARLGTSFIGFLITIIIARSFGVSGFGDFTKIISYVTLFYLILDFGLNAVYLQEAKSSYKDFFYFRLLISTIIFLGINFFAFFLPYNSYLGTGFSQSLRYGIFIFSFCIFSQSIILTASSIFQKKLNYFPYMIGLVFGSILSLSLVFLFSFLNYSLNFILISFVLGSFLTAFLLIKLSGENIFPFSFNKNFSKELFLKSIPIGLMLIFNLIYFKADIIILSVLVSSKDVGIYGLSYKFFDFLLAIPLFLSNSIYPLLLVKEQSKKEFFNLSKKYFFIFLFSSLILIIPFWFISPLFSLIKSDFSISIIPFRILLLSLPFFFATSLLQWMLIALKKQKFLMYVYFFSTILNIALNIMFVPTYSYLASSWITVFSEGLVFVVLITKAIQLELYWKEK
jgi:O-antigen/teichoic acid export membrane protein